MKKVYGWVLRSAMAIGIVGAVALSGAGCGGGGDDDAAATQSVTGNRYALSVGIDNYAPGYASSLPSCRNDANGFAGELARDGTLWKGGDKTLPASIVVWTDSQATLAALRAKLQELAGVAQSGDLVVYFHSSHGGNNGSSGYTTDTFLCAYDTEYEDEVLAQDLALFRDGVSVIIVIDACFSAGMYKGGPSFDFPQRVMAAMEKNCKARDVKGPSVGWLASSDYSETSAAGPVYSLFTQYLLEGFASGDANADGNVTFKELFDYAYPRVLGSHTPQSMNDSLLSSVVAAAVDSGASSGGDSNTGGNATLRVSNQFSYDQTIYVDEVQVGVVPVGQTQDFTVTAGTHTVRAWDSVTGSLTDQITFAEGSVQTFTIVAMGVQQAKALAE